MTSQQEQITLQEKLREVLGGGPAATLMSMLPHTDDLATKADLFEVRQALRSDMASLKEELKGEMASIRTEVAFLRQEMELKYATKDDLLAAVNGFNDTMAGHVRTFIVVQAATVVGMSGILFGLLRFT
jgi:hypothetical protein